MHKTAILRSHTIPAHLVSFALPLAILLSSIMTFGNLGERYELAAMKSAGISLLRTMRPLIFVSILISLAAFYFSNNILPAANLKMGSLLFDVQQKRPALNIKENAFYAGLDGYTIRVKEKFDNGGLKDIMIYDHSSRMGNIKVVLADSGSMAMSNDDKYLLIRLFNGRSYEEMNKKGRQANPTYPFMRASFKEELIRFDMSSFAFMRTDEDLFKDKDKMLNLKQLLSQMDTLQRRYDERKRDYKTNLVRSYYKRMDLVDSIKTDFMQVVTDTAILDNFERAERVKILEIASNLVRSAKAYTEITVDDLEIRQRNILRHDIEFHRKFTLSIACIVLFFIGAPLGAIIRKGGLGLPVVMSIIFFLLYYISSIIGEKFSKEAVMEPQFGMWISTFLLFPIGLYLTQKATTDSVVLNTEAYARFFSRLKPRKK